MANNEGLIEEQRLFIPAEVFPQIAPVMMGGIEYMQLSQQASMILQNILHGRGYGSNWDEDRTVLTIKYENQNEPIAELYIEQVADGDEYEFVVRGTDEVAVDEIGDTGPGGIMDQFVQQMQQLWNAAQPAPVAPQPAIPIAPPPAIPIAPPPAGNQNNGNMNMEMEGGRRRKRRTTRKRKARKTRKVRKARRGNRRTLYRRAISRRR